jgi:hypothetical protein
MFSERLWSADSNPEPFKKVTLGKEVPDFPVMQRKERGRNDTGLMKTIRSKQLNQMPVLSMEGMQDTIKTLYISKEPYRRY